MDSSQHGGANEKLHRHRKAIEHDSVTLSRWPEGGGDYHRRQNGLRADSVPGAPGGGHGFDVGSGIVSAGGVTDDRKQAN